MSTETSVVQGDRVFELPILYKVSKAGAIQQWSISVVDVGGVINLLAEYGQVDGQKQVAYREVLTGKNLGKKNETTPLDQAIFEATSLWRKQVDKEYSEIPPTVGSFVSKRPMAAEKYQDHQDKVVYPCHVQPKLEGIRCVARKVTPTDVHYLSRNGKRFKGLEHLDFFYLNCLHVGQEVDGELYNHGGCTFEELTSFVKTGRCKENGIKHHLFDFPSHPGNFEDRYWALNDLFSDMRDLSEEVNNYIEVVTSHSVYGDQGIDSFSDYYTSEGYEGVMIRNTESLYQHGVRTTDLLKFKTMQDAEFPIIKIVRGKGKDKDSAVFELVCNNGNTFRAAPIGTSKLRMEYYEKRESLIGKLATIRFQRYTDDNVPYLPKLVAIRDYE